MGRYDLRFRTGGGTSTMTAVMLAERGCKPMSHTGRELRSTVSDGVLRLTLEEVVTGDLAPDEIVVRVLSVQRQLVSTEHR
jgi:hypothetical protein